MEDDGPHEYMKGCECEEIMKDISDLNHADRVIIRMLHKKCAVIARARDEMNNLDEKFNKHIEELKRRELLTKKIWRKKFGIIMLACILFTAWFFIMYGVILGSLLCSRIPIRCRVMDSLTRIPGLSRRQNSDFQGENRVF